MRLAIVLLFMLAPLVPLMGQSTSPPATCLGTLMEAITFPGLEVMASAPIAGQLESILVREGDRIEKGSLIARFDQQDEQLMVDRLTKVVKKKAFDNRSLEKLLQDNMTSQNEALQAKLEREIAELDLARAKLALSRRELLAPVDGVVVKIFHQPGEWVYQGKPVFEVVQTRKLFARVMADESQAKLFRVSMPVQLLFEGNRIEKTGTVIFIDPRFDLASGLKLMKIEFANPDELVKPGMRGTVCVSK